MTSRKKCHFLRPPSPLVTLCHKFYTPPPLCDVTFLKNYFYTESKQKEQLILSIKF